MSEQSVTLAKYPLLTANSYLGFNPSAQTGTYGSDLNADVVSPATPLESATQSIDPNVIGSAISYAATPLDLTTSSADYSTNTAVSDSSADDPLIISPLAASTFGTDRPAFVGGFLNPVVAMPVQKWVTTPTTVGKSTMSPSADPGAGANDVVSPSWQTPPGGGEQLPTFSKQNSTFNNTSMIQSNWLAGDPNTSLNGDPGNYDHVAANVTGTQALSGLNSQPQASWEGTVESYANSGDYTDALQTTYNNAEWDVQNIGSAGGNYATSITEASATADIVGCIGGVVAATAGLAAAVADPPAAGFAAWAGWSSISTGIGVTAAACAAAIDNTPPNGYVIASGQSSGLDGLMYAMDGEASAAGFGLEIIHGDFTEPGSSAKPATSSSGVGGSYTPQITPGFSPSQATLNALKPELSYSALAKYFPSHG